MKRIKKLNNTNFNESSPIAVLFRENIKWIFGSKGFWIFILIVIAIFILTKSLNQINSIYWSVNTFMRNRQLVFTNANNLDPTNLFGNINTSTLDFVNSQEYVDIMYGVAFNRIYISQLTNMEVFYNFSILLIGITTSNIILFKRIKSGSILTYLSAPITKTRIMWCSLLSSFIASFAALVLMHSLETITSSVINNTFNGDDLQERVGAWVGRLANDDIYQYAPQPNTPLYSLFEQVYVVTQERANLITDQIQKFLSSWTLIDYVKYFFFSLLATTTYLVIILGLCFIILLVTSVTKAVAIMITVAVAFGVCASIFAFAVPDPEEYIYGFKLLFWPNLTNDMYIYLLKDYGKFSFNFSEVLDSLETNYPNLYPYDEIATLPTRGNSFVKDSNTEEMWFSKELVYSILPLTAISLTTSLPFIYRRVDWK